MVRSSELQRAGLHLRVDDPRGSFEHVEMLDREGLSGVLEGTVVTLLVTPGERSVLFLLGPQSEGRANTSEPAAPQLRVGAATLAPPIVYSERGGLMGGLILCLSIDALERESHAKRVLEGSYECYDAEGRRIWLEADDRERVRVHAAEVHPSAGEQLRVLLQTWEAATGSARAEGIERWSGPRLIAETVQSHTPTYA